jgi:hypothetical protein
MRGLRAALLAGVLGVAGGLVAATPRTPAADAGTPAAAAEHRAAAMLGRAPEQAVRRALEQAARSAPDDGDPRQPRSASGAALAQPGQNLLVNPGAEAGSCTASGYDAMTLPGWQTTLGSPNAVCYGLPGLVPKDLGRGKAYFAGGATGDAAMDQLVDVRAAADAIDAGQVDFDLSGRLGGWAGQNDRVKYGLVFEAGDGTPLASSWVPAVTNTERGKATGFVTRDRIGRVPPGTRQIDVTVEYVWTSGDTTDGYADDLSLSLTAPVSRPALNLPPSNVPKFDHVFFVFMGNENYAQGEAPAGAGHHIVGNPLAPYLNRTLAKQGSLLSQMYATAHPSDPNLLAVTGGSTFGWRSNLVVGEDQVEATHIGDRLDAAGKTWVGYADGMAYQCDTRNRNTASGGYYRPDSEPFMLYRNVVSDPVRCAAHNKSLAQLDTDLASEKTTPNLVWFAADDYNNMKQGGVAAGDRWLSQMLPKIFESPAWLRSRSLLIVSWDQGHDTAYGPEYPNHVATYVLGSQGTVKQGYVSPLRYSDYSLGATICDALRVKTMTSNDTYAQRLIDVWPDSSGGGNPATTISLRGP